MIQIEKFPSVARTIQIRRPSGALKLIEGRQREQTTAGRQSVDSVATLLPRINDLECFTGCVSLYASALFLSQDAPLSASSVDLNEAGLSANTTNSLTWRRARQIIPHPRCNEFADEYAMPMFRNEPQPLVCVSRFSVSITHR